MTHAEFSIRYVSAGEVRSGDTACLLYKASGQSIYFMVESGAVGAATNQIRLWTIKLPPEFNGTAVSPDFSEWRKLVVSRINDFIRNDEWFRLQHGNIFIDDKDM